MYRDAWMEKPEKFSYLFEKQPRFRDYILIPFVNMLKKVKYSITKLHPGFDSSLCRLCKHCVILLLLTRKSPKLGKFLSSMLVSLPKSNMMTFYDKFISCKQSNHPMLPILLFRTLLQESISNGKDSMLFWTPAYKELSEKLWLPTETDLLDSVLNSSSTSLRRQEENSPFWKLQSIPVVSKNCPRTYFPSYMSTVVKEWENEATESKTMKAIKIKLPMNKEKKQLYQQWMYTSDFAYNKAIAAVQKGEPVNFYNLRNKLVTANTKKEHPEYKKIDESLKTLRIQKKNAMDEEKKNTSIDKKKKTIKTINEEKKKEIDKEKERIEKETQTLKEQLKEIKKQLKSIQNEGVFEWELETPKEVRAMAVQDVCTSYKSVFTNLRKGNITHFSMGFRKKNLKQQCMVIPKNFIRCKDGKITIGESYFKNEADASISMGKKTIKKHKDLEITHDCRMIRKNQEYWLCIPIEVDAEMRSISTYKNYCGIDPGVRTFFTTFGNQGCQEYQQTNILDELDKKIENLKSKKGCYKSSPRKCVRRRIQGVQRIFIKNRNSIRLRKCKLEKLQRRKENVINELHWKIIRSLLETNDILFYGDIKSHNIVRKKENSTLNRRTNNLKFYLFKQRLQSKSIEMGKKVILVKEHFTTKTCSFCGTINNPKESKIYECKCCKRKVGRDVNAAKNILMKGLFQVCK